MPQIKEMQMAIHVATEFVSKYHPFRQVRGSNKDAASGTWCVEFTVGRKNEGRAKVCVEQETGQVVTYESSI